MSSKICRPYESLPKENVGGGAYDAPVSKHLLRDVRGPSPTPPNDEKTDGRAVALPLSYTFFRCFFSLYSSSAASRAFATDTLPLGKQK